MASMLLNGKQDFTKKDSEDKTALMSETSPDTKLTADTESPLSLNDIQIHIPQENENAIPSSHQSPQELRHHSSCPVDNGLDTEEGETVTQQRRIGVVDASDTVGAERMNTRVLRKKFGEGWVSKMPGIFNKKL